MLRPIVADGGPVRFHPLQCGYLPVRDRAQRGGRCAEAFGEPAAGRAARRHEAGVHDLEDQITQRLSIDDALESLSPAHREVISLAHEHGLTQTEIAERLAIPLGTVKTRMFHGLRALRAALAERGFDV